MLPGLPLRCLLVALLCAPPAHAGDIAAFEKAATKGGKSRPKTTAPSRRQDDDREDEDDGCGFNLGCVLFEALLGPSLEFAAGLVFTPFVALGSSSVQRQQGPDPEAETPSRMTKRAVHDHDIPLLALDLNHQQVEGDILGLETRAEVGWAPIGLQVRNVHYRHEPTDAALDISHAHLMLRGSFQHVQLNLGAGGIRLDGQQVSSGPSGLVQLSAFPGKHLAIDTGYLHSKINGNTIREYDGAIALYHAKGYGLRAGYKLNETGSEVLRGPYLGLSWRY